MLEMLSGVSVGRMFKPSNDLIITWGEGRLTEDKLDKIDSRVKISPPNSLGYLAQKTGVSGLKFTLLQKKNFNELYVNFLQW
jgi:hypothetical protein